MHFRIENSKAISWVMACLLVGLMGGGGGRVRAQEGPKDLGLSALGAQARSWEPGAHVIPEHEPFRVNDGSLHTYWAVRAEDLPADIGIEWPKAQEISSAVVRYFDGRMVGGPVMARTQQWARLQCWDHEGWKDLDAKITGQETSVVRYTFPAVTTTRLRLLYSEPPDPESRRTPDTLGIYVCEFEAYKEAPFQIVDAPNHLVLRQNHAGESGSAYGRWENVSATFPGYYNPWSSDNSYDAAGPLVIEPKQTRVFADTLRPTLIVAESQWVKVPCAIDQSRSSKTGLKNGFLKLDVATEGTLGESKLTNLVTGEEVSTPAGLGFRIRTAQGQLTPVDFHVAKTDTSGSDAEASRLRIDLSSPALDVSVHYELQRHDHFYHKWLTLTNKTGADLRVMDLTLSSLGLSPLLDLMAGPELTYPIYRMTKGGFFTCLETPYWEHVGDTLTYYPGTMIAPGKTFESEKAVVGVYRNRGEEVERFDLGVRDWVIEYHAHVSPIAKEWPDFYLEGWSAKFGMQELVERPQWAEHFFATAHRMGVRFMDTYEPADLALLMPPDLQRRWVDLANRYEIGTGWWNDFGSGLGWGVIAPYSQQNRCKLSPDAEKYFDQIVDLVKTYRLRGFHWADFWAVWPCNNPDHAHLPGKYSIYAQGQRMLRFNEQMHEVSPGAMLGADSGLDNPQYGRHADSRLAGGGVDGHPSIEPDIHLDRLYADMNRDNLYGLSHESILRPWFRVLNCVNHYGMESHHHDRAGYRFALLSALGLAPQLTFNDAPEDIPESELQFTQHWEEWAKAHQDYLKEGDKLFDRTIHFNNIMSGNPEGLDGYSHIRGDRGYIFLENPGPVEQIAELTLALDAAPSEKFSVEEVYPGGMTLQGPDEGAYLQGGKLRVTVPAKQIRILWIAPAASAGRPANLHAENARAAEWNRYVGEWTVSHRNTDTVTVRATFNYPRGAQSYLSSAAPEAAWVKEPWNFDKAYLVLLLKDESVALDDNWVPDNLTLTMAHQGEGTTWAGEMQNSYQAGPLTVQVNGVAKLPRPFKTARTQNDGLTRCYFIALEGETKPGDSNVIEISLPVQRGLVFSGVYLDLPDQLPFGELPGE